MSYPEIGAPVGADRPTDPTARVFSYIPRLWELLRQPPGGWPGVVYAQVCVHNMKRATDRMERPANLRPIHGVEFFTIRGPRGDAQMALMGTGKRIRAASPLGGARLFFTDGEVSSLTGLPVENVPGVDPIWFGPKPQEEAPHEQTQKASGQKPQRSEGGARHARVGSGGASQRLEEGTGG